MTFKEVVLGAAVAAAGVDLVCGPCFQVAQPGEEFQLANKMVWQFVGVLSRIGPQAKMTVPVCVAQQEFWS